LTPVLSSKSDAKINKVSWKNIYLYRDHISVYSAKSEEKPNTLLEKVFPDNTTHNEFLIDLDYSLFIKPCN